MEEKPIVVAEGSRKDGDLSAFVEGMRSGGPNRFILRLFFSRATGPLASRVNQG